MKGNPFSNIKAEKKKRRQNENPNSGGKRNGGK